MKKLDVPQSGSQADTTASRNRFGQYNRTRAMPTQPRTTAQLQVRGWLAAVSQAWSGLTDEQRLGWNSYASAHPRTDSLGQTIALTGHQMFVGVNITNLQTSQAIQSAVPNGEPVDAAALTITPTTAVGIILKASTAIPSDTYFVAFASPPMSPGRSFNGDFRVVHSGIGTNAANQSLVTAAQLSAKFGSLVTGQKFFFQVALTKGGNQSAVTPTSTVLT